MSETLGQQALLKLESMAHSASKLWQHHNKCYSAATRPLWNIIKDVCETAYMLGRADADYKAGRALDTLDAQRTPCCCEKLMKEAQSILSGDTVYYEDLLKLCKALAQPCSCQRTEASAGSEWDFDERLDEFHIMAHGQTLFRVENEWTAKTCVKEHNAALRRSRVQPGAEQEPS